MSQPYPLRLGGDPSPSCMGLHLHANLCVCPISSLFDIRAALTTPLRLLKPHVMDGRNACTCTTLTLNMQCIHRGSRNSCFDCYKLYTSLCWSAYSQLYASMGQGHSTSSSISVACDPANIFTVTTSPHIVMAICIPVGRNPLLSPVLLQFVL